MKYSWPLFSSLPSQSHSSRGGRMEEVRDVIKVLLVYIAVFALI